MKIVDEIANATGWIEEQPSARTSHALEVEGRVWLFDVVDWPDLDARVRELGEPAGVVQLLDRHRRDCAAVAQRLGVPHLVVPRQLPGTPFELRPGRAVPLVARGCALVGGASPAARRRRDRHDSVLLRRRGTGRRPPVSSAVAAALAARPRARPSARRDTARGSTSIRRRSRARCERRDGGSALARRTTAERARGALARAGE